MKTEQTEQTENLDLKQELKVLNALNKLFNVEQINPTEEDTLKENYFIMTPCHIAGIIGLNNYSKLLLRRFINSEYQKEYPSLNFSNDCQNGVKISIEYLTKFLKVFECSDKESIKIYANNDYPLKIENRFFRVIIAPRIEED